MSIVGETLAGRYRIDEALGAGATAVVYLGHDLRLDRDVAIKVLLPNLARDPLVAGRFDREARALAAAANPGVVSVYDVDRGDPETGREPYFVMELCEDGSLADALDAAGGRLSPEVLVPMLVVVAGGLASLHARGVVHRDIKPHNILRCGAGAKLADFGLARASDATRFTAPGTAAGTLAYLPPEVLGGHEPGPPSDVYGLGIVAFQGLTGRMPRLSGSMVDLVDARNTPVAPVSAVAPDLGTAFDGIVGAALSPDPVRRPSPANFAVGLQQALLAWRAKRPAGRVLPLPGRAGATTQRVRMPAARPVRRQRGLPLWLIGPRLLLLALLVGGVVAMSGLVPGFGGPSASPTRRPTPRPTASVTAPLTLSPTPWPSPTPARTPAPTLTETPTAPWPQAAQQQIDDIRSAIADALGHDLSDKDADDLIKTADQVEQAVQRGDRNAAADTARRLADQIDHLISDGHLVHGLALSQAVAELQNTLEGTG